jgi:hypothetical protein
MCSMGSANGSNVALRESLGHVDYKYDPAESKYTTTLLREVYY